MRLGGAVFSSALDGAAVVEFAHQSVRPPRHAGNPA